MTLCGTLRIFPSLLFLGNPKYIGPPDQTGKVVAITGGNTGIGYEVCKGMLAANAKVYLCARSPDKALKAIEQLKKETGKDKWSVKSAAEELLSKESSLHILFNNAGLLGSEPDERTNEGFEMQFGTNVLGHHVFTHLLLPTLTETANKSSDGTTRVISTGSFVQYMARANELDFENLEQGGPKGVKSYDLYCRSKIGNSIWTNAMARRYTLKGSIIFLTVNPGLISSGGLLERGELATYITSRTIGHPTTSGAVSLLYCGTSSDISKVDTGSYYVPWCRKGTPIKVTLDTKVQDRLFDLLEKWRLEKL